jgi:hypothetical protein
MQRKPLYSYDFDGVLHLDMVPDAFESGVYYNRDFLNPRTWQPFSVMHEQLREQATYATIVIVTARDKWNAPEIWEFINMHQLPVEAVYCTDNGPKGNILRAIGAIRHYDDRDYSFELVGSGIQFIRIDPGLYLLT